MSLSSAELSELCLDKLETGDPYEYFENYTSLDHM